MTLEEAMTAAVEAVAKVERYKTFKPFSGLVYKMLLQEAREAMVVYRAAIDFEAAVL